MKKWFKRIVIGCVVCLIAAFIGIAIFILNFDPSAYKDKLAKMVKEQYNRELVVNGKIELSLFPRIGLTVNDIALSEPNSPIIFTEVKTARMAVALWPLISNRFLVDHLDVNGFTTTISRDEQGNFNFEDLIRYSLFQQQETTTSKNTSLEERVANTDFKIDIAGLTLNDGQIIYKDEKFNSQTQLNNMTIRTGRITAGQAFDLSLTADVVGDKPQLKSQLEINGLMSLDPIAKRYAFNRLEANFKGQWDQLNLNQATVKGNVVIDVLADALTGTDIDVSVRGQGTDTSNIKQFTTNLVAPTLEYNIPRLSLVLNGFKLNSTLERKDSQGLSLELSAPTLNISPSQAGGDPLRGELTLSSNVQRANLAFSLEKITGTASELNVDNINLSGIYYIAPERSLAINLQSPGTISLLEQLIALPSIEGELSLREQAKGEQTIPLRGNVQTYIRDQKSQFFLTAQLPPGNVDIKGSIHNLFHPKVFFDVSGEKLDLKAFLEDIRLPLSGLASSSSDRQQIERAQTISDNRTEVVVPESAIPASRPTLTFKQELLSRLSGVGTFNFKQVFYDDITLEHLGATLNFNHHDIEVKSVRAKLFNGDLYANGEYALGKQTLKGDIKLSNLQLDTVFRDMNVSPIMNGTADANILFSSFGETEQVLREHLQAEIKLTATKGHFNGIDVDAILNHPDDYIDPWELSAPFVWVDGAQTPFDRMIFDGRLNNKQLQINQLEILSPVFTLSAKPDVANYHMDMQYLYLPSTLKTKKAFKVKKGKVVADVKSVSLPLLIFGQLSALNAKLQVDNLVK
ncbi:AsmA family protein [Pelistega sp. NLN82]|uniref:AsmA family protein n=1 Tax=Pelistega ratti TaxID=2652177 RepID=A0A6L9Y7R5_9BURK|nr:AsmA family protein [Pelistega ratti]NEN76419.1 AsmA family protein [Pelistega ratti]